MLADNKNRRVIDAFCEAVKEAAERDRERLDPALAGVAQKGFRSGILRSNGAPCMC